MSANEIEYLREKRVPELLESLMAQLLAARPDSPYLFLRQVLNKPLTPQIIIAGPPASGKGAQSEKIVARFGVVHISTGDLLRAEVRADTELGRQAGALMKSGALVPDEIVIEMIRKRLQQPDVRERGWLLDGFPRNLSQALALNKAGLVPQAFILLDVPDQVVQERIAGRRVDPVTGATYHLTHSPPPQDNPELLARLVQRRDDTPEAIVSRLATYHKNLEQIVEVYQSVVAKVNGNRDRDAIAKDVIESVSERLFV